MEYRRPQSYEDRFLAVSTKLERLLFRGAMLGFGGILVSQLILSWPDIRETLSPTDRLEGQKISETDQAQAAVNVTAAELTIRPVSAQAGSGEAWVKLNGTPVSKMGESGVVLKVKSGDKIEVDTSPKLGIYQFEIDHNDPSITSPTPGTIIESSEHHAAVIESVLIHAKSLAR